MSDIKGSQIRDSGIQIGDPIPQIVRGTRVHAQWLQVNDPLSGLAGMQPKVGATMQEVVGVVMHIRGDHPTNPTTVRLWVQPDAGGDEVLVDPDHVVAVLPPV